MDSDAYREVLLRLSALERRVNAIFRVGKAAEVTLDPYRVRVDIGPGEGGGPVLTDPLPVFVLAAGDVRIWTPVAVGERCAVFSPGGEDFSAFVLQGFYSEDFASPSAEPARFVAAVGSNGAQLTMTAAGQVLLENGQGHSLELSAAGAFTARVSDVDFVRT